MTRILGSWKILCYEHGVIAQHIFDLEHCVDPLNIHRNLCGSRLFICEEWNSDMMHEHKQNVFKNREDKRILNQLHNYKERIENDY